MAFSIHIYLISSVDFLLILHNNLLFTYTKDLLTITGRSLYIAFVSLIVMSLQLALLIDETE